MFANSETVVNSPVYECSIIGGHGNQNLRAALSVKQYPRSSRTVRPVKLEKHEKSEYRRSPQFT